MWVFELIAKNRYCCHVPIIDPAVDLRTCASPISHQKKLGNRIVIQHFCLETALGMVRLPTVRCSFYPTCLYEGVFYIIGSILFPQTLNIRRKYSLAANNQLSLVSSVDLIRVRNEASGFKPFSSDNTLEMLTMRSRLPCYFAPLITTASIQSACSVYTCSATNLKITAADYQLGV